MSLKDPASSMSLQFTNHSTSLSSNLTSLLRSHMHCDVVLACKDGLKLPAHKIILSACSNYFKELLEDTEIHQETIVVLRDINIVDMKAVLDFLYSGVAQVPKDRLTDFLFAANMLKIEELAQDSREEFAFTENINRNSVSDANDEVTPTVKIEPETFLDVMQSDNIEPVIVSSDNSDADNIKVELPELLDMRPPEAARTLQIRTDILSSGGSSIMKSDPPSLPQHHQHPIPLPPEQAQINFPETAQELVRNRIFGWNQKRSLTGLESAEKILTKKPCVCTQCGARFSYRNQLTEHKRTAHD